ncbi:unnamed protein product [Prorocentrum cordatum]|uniref:Uncharacterized protein n=1 Tax=Prorocentrum cordatum TaxID=2364126 RepID=A0ABN9XFL4_9DINO|nr:unnamed protein product [Polarella glacialis]
MPCAPCPAPGVRSPPRAAGVRRSSPPGPRGPPPGPRPRPHRASWAGPPLAPMAAAGGLRGGLEVDPAAAVLAKLGLGPPRAAGAPRARAASAASRGSTAPPSPREPAWASGASSASGTESGGSLPPSPTEGAPRAAAPTLSLAELLAPPPAFPFPAAAEAPAPEASARAGCRCDPEAPPGLTAGPGAREHWAPICSGLASPMRIPSELDEDGGSGPALEPWFVPLPAGARRTQTCSGAPVKKRPLWAA